MKITKLTVNLNEETAAALVEISNEDGVNITEVVRRAVGTYSFLRKQANKPTRQIYIFKRGKPHKEIVLI